MQDLKRTNLSIYLDNQIDKNLEGFKLQLNNWYKLFEYSLEKDLFKFL